MCSGFEALDLEGWPSDSAATLVDVMRMDQGVLTSDSNEAAGTTEGRGVPRNLVHSWPSLSFNTRRSSGIGRLRAASKDIAAAVTIQLCDNLFRIAA